MFILSENPQIFTTHLHAFRAPGAPSWCLPTQGTTRIGRNDSARSSPRGHRICGRQQRAPGRQPGWSGGPPGRGMGDEPALARHQAHVLRGGRHPAARLGTGGAHAGPAGRRAAVDAPAHRGLRALAGRANRQPGGTAGPCRAPGDLPVRLAGSRGRQPGRADLPGPACTRSTRCRRWSAGSTTR